MCYRHFLNGNYEWILTQLNAIKIYIKCLADRNSIQIQLPRHKIKSATHQIILLFMFRFFMEIAKNFHVFLTV